MVFKLHHKLWIFMQIPCLKRTCSSLGHCMHWPMEIRLLIIILLCFAILMAPPLDSSSLSCLCNWSFPTIGVLKNHRNHCFKWKSYKKNLVKPNAQKHPQIAPEVQQQPDSYAGLTALKFSKLDKDTVDLDNAMVR